MKKLIPSTQQQVIYDWVANGSGNAVLEAVAGAGKTTTLIEAVRLMRGTVAFAAYNKKIAVEIQDRVSRAETTAQVKAGTFHSFGFQAWRKVAPKVRVDDRKTAGIFDELKVPEKAQGFVKQAVSLAKQYAIGFLSSVEDAATWMHVVNHFSLDEMLEEDEAGISIDEAIDWSRKVLKRSIALDTEVIDFDDMIYAPLVHNARMWQNDWVLIDEAQDTNPARRALAKKMLRPGGRLIAVGDPHQAIYGFTGADADSLLIIQREFSATTLPLTVTYRCPKAVVSMAQRWVNHIEAHPSSPEGEVSTLEYSRFVTADFDPTDVILCRNTKPLVELAYTLIRRGVSCHVEGRDIGKGLLALVNRWSVKSLEAFRLKLEQWLEKETQKLLAKGQEQKAGALADKVETLAVLMGALPPSASVNDLRAKIETLFQDTDPAITPRRLTLSTIHKSKGREWERVYWLGRNKYQPSKFARQEWQLEQEINLMYVAATRAKHALVDVPVPVAAS